jgi:hypothetical protein
MLEAKKTPLFCSTKKADCHSDTQIRKKRKNMGLWLLSTIATSLMLPLAQKSMFPEVRRISQRRKHLTKIHQVSFMIIYMKQQIQLELIYWLASHSHGQKHQTSFELWRNSELRRAGRFE